jgi:(1->4)-alpha-D-glucan 1-alpha-D-glucosylmutase
MTRPTSSPQSPAPPTSTYRLQIRESFTLHDAAATVDYLADLGVGAVYCSPLLHAASGSDHGYDVVDLTQIDPARGGSDGWRTLLAETARRGLGTVVDIVPNHLGVANASENRAWWDVLRLGQRSVYADWFDIEWTRGRILLPVLGDDADLTTDLTVVDGELRYRDHRFPLAPDTGPSEGETAASVHHRQHYKLVNFRRADTDQNYRRFFAVTTLAGLRVEDRSVFNATHEEIARWVHDDRITGLRVDHPDGLVDPASYTTRLRELAPMAWITVEKILEPDEDMPDWPVDGTTGYDALTEVNQLFIDPAGEAPLTALYQELTGDQRDFEAHVAAGKQFVATGILQAEINRLARLVPNVNRAAEALRELIVAFPVYRSYLPDGHEHLDYAVGLASERRPELIATIAALLPRLCEPDDELCRRFQQTTGAVMAKGVEDTAYYRYTRFVALNEVGGNPNQFGMTLEQFHVAQRRRQRGAARSMTTLSTHDTKRGEDVRARLAVLAEIHQDWDPIVRRLMAAAPIPNKAFGYLLWQTFAGTGFIDRARMHGYAEKAMREAADGTNWVDPDEHFESSVHQAVDAAYDNPDVHEPLRALIDGVTPSGRSNGLSQKLVQLTMPGIPDLYQGTERWDDSLVDPDNRRPVDFTTARQVLRVEQPPIDGTGAVKQWITAKALKLRRDHTELFSTYQPVVGTGDAANHLIAFDRGGAITVATRLPEGLRREGGWRDTTIDLAAGEYVDLLTGRASGGRTPASDVLAVYPVALLQRQS